MIEGSSLRGGWAGERRRNRTSGFPVSLLLGAIGVALLVLFVIVGSYFLSYAPNHQDLTNRLQPASPAHWFGTDNYGRDLFTRIFHAGRIDLQIAIIATFFAFFSGTFLGALAGFYEGVLDTVLMRALDILLAFPILVLVIAIVGLFGQDLLSLYLAISLVGWVPYARLVRGEVMVAKHLDYVLAAKAIGCGDGRLLWRHILPHSISSAIVYATSSVTFNILAISSLGYLGLGIRPPQAEWGAMIAEGRSFILTSPALVLYPALALSFTGLTFSLLGDGLAEVLQLNR